MIQRVEIVRYDVSSSSRAQMQFLKSQYVRTWKWTKFDFELFQVSWKVFFSKLNKIHELMFLRSTTMWQISFQRYRNSLKSMKQIRTLLNIVRKTRFVMSFWCELFNTMRSHWIFFSFKKALCRWYFFWHCHIE